MAKKEKTVPPLPDIDSMNLQTPEELEEAAKALKAEAKRRRKEAKVASKLEKTSGQKVAGGFGFLKGFAIVVVSLLLSAVLIFVLVPSMTPGSTKVDNLGTEVDSLRAELASVKISISDTNASIDKLSSGLDSVKSSIDQIQSNQGSYVKNSSAGTYALKDDLSSLQSSVSSLASKVDTLNSNVVSLMSRVATLEEKSPTNTVLAGVQGLGGQNYVTVAGGQTQVTIPLTLTVINGSGSSSNISLTMIVRLVPSWGSITPSSPSLMDTQGYSFWAQSSPSQDCISFWGFATGVPMGSTRSSTLSLQFNFPTIDPIKYPQGGTLQFVPQVSVNSQ